MTALYIYIMRMCVYVLGMQSFQLTLFARTMGRPSFMAHGHVYHVARNTAAAAPWAPQWHSLAVSAVVHVSGRPIRNHLPGPGIGGLGFCSRNLRIFP